MNAKQLSIALDRFNAPLAEADHLALNWGREGRTGTWFLHGEYGVDLRTGLSFEELARTVKSEIEAHKEYLDAR